MTGRLIEFVRKRDYLLVKELGQGACGKTVLLHDDVIDELFVCKKYLPYYPTHKQELFDNFIREIKILHGLYHRNVVRVYNYYLYPELFTGYILMEFVDGVDIGTYVRLNPDKINDIYIQMVNGFNHLESQSVLHRDIRLANIMVNSSGVLKVIDFGFGKQISRSASFNKSVSLNWWCDLPDEFELDVYDFRTEVYFVGMLFSKLVADYDLSNFKYSKVLDCMCQRNPLNRVASFFDVKKMIETDKINEVYFSSKELVSYRKFASELVDAITKIENDTRYIDDAEKVLGQLVMVYKKVMLEKWVENISLIVNCFLSGEYYFKNSSINVKTVDGFIKLLQSSTYEKQGIILANLYTRLDYIQRYDTSSFDQFDDQSTDPFADVPF